MNKKLLVLVGVIALGIGGASAIAFQSHAQKISDQTGATTTPVVTSPALQENTVGDADNIQNDKGGIEKSDAAISQDTDKETKD